MFFSSLFVIHVSPVTMCLTAISRYVRMSKRDKPVQNMVFQEGPCVPGVFLDFFALYVTVPRIADFQSHKFIPGYAQCSVKQQSDFETTIHYAIVLVLFFLTPLIATLASYRKAKSSEDDPTTERTYFGYDSARCQRGNH